MAGADRDPTFHMTCKIHVLNTAGEVRRYLLQENRILVALFQPNSNTFRFCCPGNRDLHSSGSSIFSCFEAHGKTPLSRRTPNKPYVCNSSISKSKSRDDMRWDSQTVEYCAVIFGLLEHTTSEKFPRRVCRKGRILHVAILFIPWHSPDPWCDSLSLQESFCSTWSKKEGNFLPDWWAGSAFTLQSGKHESCCPRGKLST